MGGKGGGHEELHVQRPGAMRELARDWGNYLKAPQTQYRGVVSEATQIVFHDKEFELYPAGNGEAQKRALRREMR